MKQFDGLQSLQQPLSGLPQWVSERILQQINQLTHYACNRHYGENRSRQEQPV